MAISGVEQPEIVQIGDMLRLRKFNGRFDFALPWYQDEDLVYLVDGKKDLYTMERLEQMYRYLDVMGELYFIEVLEGDCYKPVGDVTFWQEDMPIVIGVSEFRGKGIGRKVISALVKRGKELNYNALYVDEIYDFNEGSRRCFESVGFKAYEKTERGSRYRLELL